MMNYLVRCFVLIITSFIIIVCSCINKKILLSILTSFCFIFILLYFSNWSFNPYHLVLLRENLYSYQMTHLLHSYIPSIYVSISCIVIETLIASFLMVVFVQRRGGRKHVQGFKVGNDKNNT